MNKTIFVIALIGILAVFAGAFIVSAYRGDPNAVGPNYDSERHAEIQAALDASDYNAWVAAMTADGKHPKVVDKITEENFAKFVAARNAALSGDTQTANQLRQELGLGYGQGKHLGQMMGKGNRGNCPYA
jgi:hypothetical protein